MPLFRPKEGVLPVASIRPTFHSSLEKKRSLKPPSQFGQLVFNQHVIEKRLPLEVIENLIDARLGKAKIKPGYGKMIIEALKDWAYENGATYYTYWSDPLVKSMEGTPRVLGAIQRRTLYPLKSLKEYASPEVQVEGGFKVGYCF